MPSTTLKKLYIAKSLDELDSKTQLDVKNRPTSGLILTANKIFKAAETSYLEEDEEKAYVQYMRFIELILLLKSRPEFTKVSERKQLLEYSNKALAKADNLKSSLSKRYSILQEANCREQNERNDKEKNDSNPEVSEIVKSEISLNASNKDVIEHSISSQKLQSMLTSGFTTVIIMDARPAADYADSHIKHSHCISIPQEILKPGITAATLGKQLPAESIPYWNKRNVVDYVVLLDWDSSGKSSSSVYINTLLQAMTKWDQQCNLKKEPVILEGGYKDWMLKYPMYTTKALSFSLLNEKKSNPITADLSGIDYPDLDENIKGKDNSSKENLNGPGVLFKHSTLPSHVVNGFPESVTATDARKSKSAPHFDRNAKPKVDNRTKSSHAEHRQNIPNNLSTSNENAGGIGISQENKHLVSENCNAKPTIVSPTSQNKKVVNTDVDFVNSLNKAESLAKENFELTKQQLKNEEEFKSLCLRKELEAEESMRKEIQKQELLLLHKLNQLEVQAQEKEVEYKKMKEELLKMNKILDHYRNKDYQDKEKKLTEVEENKKNLQEEVERLREMRKKKEAQEAKMKEVSKTNIVRETVSANVHSKRTSHTSQDNLKHPNTDEYSVPLSRENSLDGSSRGLVRSHSSPNIAQMVNKEENAMKKMPVVDRSLKPKFTETDRIRYQNMNPVFGNCLVPPATGLKNLGNTCFMNSVIQCLSHTVPLADYVNSQSYMYDINRNNSQGTGGELANEFRSVIRALWMRQFKSISPKDFKNTVSRCLSVCIGNEQQDSHEFLVVLMEKLHADLNKRYMKSVPKLDPNADENVFWKHHKSYNSSIISDIFEGLLKSTLTCSSCGKTSDNFEVFSCLSVPIMNTRCSLKECFQHFVKSEKISGEAAWDCPRCKQKKEAEKCLRICRLPEVLIIQLKRFSYEGLWRRKLQTHVDFDEVFDVPCEVNSEQQYRRYSLYAIVNHYGTLEGGHYTAYCKTPSTRKWYKYDDQEVSEISSSEIKTSAAYLLFYQAFDLQSNL